MRQYDFFIIQVIGLFLLFIPAGCDDSEEIRGAEDTKGGDDKCTAGDAEECNCKGGGTGLKTCTAEEKWGNCQCSGSSDTASDTDSDTDIDSDTDTDTDTDGDAVPDSEPSPDIVDATDTGGEIETGDGQQPAGAIPADHCLAGLKTYAQNGKFKVNTKRSGSVYEYVPQVPAGCKVPIVTHNNGTGGNCSFYNGILQRLASNGFLAVCFESTQTGAGTQGMTALKTGFRDHPELIDMRIGSTGHSQGGMASFNTLAYAEKEWGSKAIYSGFAMEPASGFGANPREGWRTLYGRIKSPTAMFCGVPTDTLVQQSWVQSAYNAMSNTVEKYFYGKTGANHIGTINTDANDLIVSWFRWKLLGDKDACEYFKAIPQKMQAWRLIAKKNEKACDAGITALVVK